MRRTRDAATERSLVWLLGSPRTGSTWLLNLLAVAPGLHLVDEPLVGAHLGLPAAATLGVGAVSPGTGEGWRALDVFGERDDYFFSRRYRDSWAPPLRQLLLARLGAQLTALGGRAGRDLLVIKEPHGSEAADLLAQLLPTSRLLVLVRDGRDVVDSLLDALSAGSWASGLAIVADDPEARLRFLEDAARAWVERMRTVRVALAGHDPQRALLVRYEDLLADTLGGLQRVLGWLGRPEPADLRAHVERLSFGQVRAEDRGKGRFHRAATPGLWRENLTPAEQAAIGAIMDPTLAELGYS